MGMTNSEGAVLSYSPAGRTRGEAQSARKDSNTYFDKKETTRHREAIASLGKDAKDVRARRKDRRAEAKRTCDANMAKTKEQTRGKPPQRRRAEIAKARADCAFDVMNVEEHAAQDLEAIEAKREDEVTRRRSSRIATKNNRARTKERTRSTAREQREEMFDQVRNDLDPGVLPYFEEIKGSAAFKKLVDGGRMTPTEAVLHMAHEDPEAVFAALEREAEKELQELLHEQERWENEGGRLAPEGQPAAAELPAADGADAAGQEPVRTTRRSAKSRKATSSAPRKRGPKTRAAAPKAHAVKASSEEEQHERDVERFEDEGGRPPSADEAHAREPKQPRRRSEPRGEEEAPPVGIDRDGDDWIAFTWAESQRFKSRSGAVGWLRERGFHPDGTPIGAPEDAPHAATARDEDADKDASSDNDASPESVIPPLQARTAAASAALARASHDELPARDERRDAAREEPRDAAREEVPEAPRPCCVGHARELAAQLAPHDVTRMQRLSPEERTLWMPGTEPARPAAPEPAPRVRTGLFDDEDDTPPETPDAKRRQGEPTEPSAAKKRDPGMQQAFGTDFTNWLNQAGPQLTLDSAPARPAPRNASQPTRAIAAPAAPSPMHEAAAAARELAPSPSAAEVPPVHSPGPPLPGAASAAHAQEADASRPWSREYTGASLHVDPTQRSIQVRFDDMPDAQFRIALRTAGFRWSPAVQRWQAPLDDERRQVAEDVLTEHAKKMAARRDRRGASAHTSRAGAPPHDAGGAVQVAMSDDPALTHGENDGAPHGEGDGAEVIDERRSAYEQKRADRVARLHARADALQAESDAIYNDTRAKADRIPFGQPILIGHHSERRDRRFRDKIHQNFGKAFELKDQAEALRRRAKVAERSDAISSDDPDAIAKLEAKVKERGDFIERARDINEILRAARASRKADWEPIAVQRMIAIGVAPDDAEKLTRKDFAGRIGIPGYALKNAQGEIARLNRRIEDLKRRDARPVRLPERIGEAVIVEDRDANRVQIRIDDLPPKELRTHLRGRGFVWAPSVGAWQRKLTDNALWTARDVLRSFYPRKPDEAVPANQAPPAAPATQDDDAEREPGLDSDPYMPDGSASGNGVEDVVPF